MDTRNAIIRRNKNAADITRKNIMEHTITRATRAFRRQNTNSVKINGSIFEHLL